MAVYKQYFNAYEKKAEEIRRAAQAVENGSAKGEERKSENKPVKTDPPPLFPKELLGGVFERIQTDDILLVALIFLLLKNEKRDTTMLLILGYLFLCGT